MHDPGSKNRFSKLSYVERTAAALSARWQTIYSLLLSLSCPLAFLSFIRRLVMANRYHDHIRFGERKRSGEFVRFIYREIFSGLTVRTERRPEVISRLYCEMNFDDALRPRLRFSTDKASSSAFSTGPAQFSGTKPEEKLNFQAENANPLSPKSKFLLRHPDSCMPIVIVLIIRRTNEFVGRRTRTILQRIARSTNRCYLNKRLS